ncbi:hypothetical protein DY000_02005347 [Brassica cretica]|uniref:Uncharacterized protein n=1 Tax=Brassica cretica TaxID=69181 RepID=A0ABQ7C1K4_BRACR|nr:hypothetical protein DY000_02005347 [Brassica cretica]
MAYSSVLLGYLKTGDCSYTVHSTVMPATMNVHRLATYRDRLQAGSPVQPELQAFRLASDSPVQ